jgi:hypothetical protein
MRRSPIPLLVLLALSLALSACNLPRPTPVGQPEPNLANTYAAQTVSAFSTQFAASTNTPPPVVVATETPTTINIVETPIPLSDSPTPQLDTTPVATQLTPSISPTALACDRVRFIRDVTVPDGTVYAAGSTFTKVWELENAGSCTWNSNYALVFANDGNAMSGPAAKLLTTGNVGSGQRIQVSVDLKAPATPGTHRGYWKLRNPNGAMFGVGSGR